MLTDQMWVLRGEGALRTPEVCPVRREKGVQFPRSGTSRGSGCWGEGQELSLKVPVTYPGREVDLEAGCTHFSAVGKRRVLKATRVDGLPQG